MSKKDLCSYSVDELLTNLSSLQENLFRLRIKRTLGDTKNSHMFSDTRKDIARIKTELSKRKRGK